MKIIQSLLCAVLLVVLCIPLCAQGGSGGKGGGGGKPAEETAMNLSYPAFFYGTSPQTNPIGAYNLGAVFPTGLSYGCLAPETIGTTTYPNTSCVETDGTPQDLATCQARCGTLLVERIYWQKNAKNYWQAGYYATGTTPLAVDYIDWGDNLEGKSWPAQVLRVETNTFSSLPYVVGGTAPNPGLRFDMWHVFGQGTNELWGVHATNADPAVPYVYYDSGKNLIWPYAVNVATGARLNIAKLRSGGATCPTTGTGITQSPFQGASNLLWSFDGTSKTGRWINAPYFTDMVYGSELNIKGSYVYGYNWNLRSEVVPPAVGKGGWWRLTFYTPDNSINFGPWLEPTPDDNTLAPPVWAGAFADPISLAPVPVTPTANNQRRAQFSMGMHGVAVAAEEESGLMLYVPQVDPINQLTYLDICILEGKAGGGRK